MTGLKLTTNKALQCAHAATRATRLATELANAERVAPVNVHSHGAMIAEALAELDSATHLMLQFLTTVQGR